MMLRSDQQIVDQSRSADMTRDKCDRRPIDRHHRLECHGVDDDGVVNAIDSAGSVSRIRSIPTVVDVNATEVLGYRLFPALTASATSCSDLERFQRTFSLTGIEISVPTAHRQAIRFPNRLAPDNFDPNIQVPNDRFDHLQLLVIFTSKERVRCRQCMEQLQDNRCDATKVCRAEFALPAPRDVRRIDERAVAVGVHLAAAGHEYGIRTNRLQRFAVGLQSSRVICRGLRPLRTGSDSRRSSRSSCRTGGCCVWPVKDDRHATAPIVGTRPTVRPWKRFS